MAASTTDTAIPRRRTIGRRLAVLVGALVALSLLASSAASWLFLRDLVRQEVEARLWSDAVARRDALETYIVHQQERIGLVASRTRLRGLLAELAAGEIDPTRFDAEARPILEDARQDALHLGALWVTDVRGRVVAFTDPALRGADLSATEAFRAGQQGRHVGLPEPGRPGHEGLLAAPARVDDALVGVVMGRADHAPLADILSAARDRYETLEIQVSSRVGDEIRFHFRDDGRRDVVPLAEAPAAAAAIAGESGFARTLGTEGQDVLAVHLPVGLPDVGLVAQIAVAEVRAPIRRLYLRLLVVGAAVLAIGVIVSLVAARRFTRPIIGLGRAARAFAAGELDARADVRTGDELETLAATFNEMAAALKRHRDHLEDLVADRTGELTREIYRRADAERVIEASERRFRSVAQTAPDALISADDAGRITFLNPAAERMFGWPAADARGQSLTILMPPRFHDPHQRGLERYLETGEAHLIGRTAEVVGLRRSGDEFPVEIALAAWPDPDGRTAFTAILRDITERKQAEAALRGARAAAEQASRAKSEFLANMSHEIRTPMNGILGMADVLLGLRLESRHREYVEIIRRSAESLLALLNDILDLSRIEADRLELEEVPFSLRDTLGDALQAMAVRAEEKGLELIQEIPAEVPDGLRGDPIRLRQIVVNLVGNAVKFTEHGEVLVSITEEARAGDEVTLCFAVRDTGPGIPEGARQRVFQAFEQADPTIGRRYGGTGLGLAISSRLVAAMGGRIWLESEVGRGSTFRFTTRLRLCPEAAAVPRSPATLRGLRVLVVDDNDTNRRVLTELLSSWGMSPVPVAGAAEAEAALRRALDEGRPFGLALLDAMMPEVDGFALAERIRAEARLVDLHLIMLSSASRAGDSARAQRARIARRLTKPVKQSDLLRAIQSEVGEAQVIQEAVDHVARRESAHPLRILVAEDDPVNRKVAETLLRRRGHTLTMVENGRLAVEAVARERFDVVLMDVRMPELDGLSATRAIREREQTTGGHVPIVAMTAHAMMGDREQCLEAGMDDYVSKPVRAEDLYRTIERFNGGNEMSTAETTTEENTPGAEPLIDWQGAADRLGDEDTLKAVAEAFLDQLPEFRDELRQAVTAGDPTALREAAHRVKGALFAVGAHPVAAVAQRLERLGATAHLDAAAEIGRELDDQLARLADELTRRVSRAT